MKLFDVLSRQRRLIYLVVAVLSAAGVWATLRLPSAIYPELEFSRITVVAQGSTLGVRQVVFSITRPLEEAVSIVPGVTRVRSHSIRGAVEMQITFAPRTDMAYALQLVRARVNQIQGDLPAGLDIEVERLAPSLFPILSYNLEGGDPATLYDIARYEIKPLISRVPGVGRVDVMGSDVREIEVIADPARLAQQDLTYTDLADAIRRAVTVQAVGRVAQDYRQYLIVTDQEAHSADDVGAVVVKGGLRVRDLATVRLGTEDHVRIVAGDGRPAALLNITRQLGGNTLAIADSVARIAAALAPGFPPGVHLKPVYDQAALVRDAVTAVRDAMLVGATLAVIVLLLFLRHGLITAISATSIPLTLAITMFVMSVLGQSFNLMTLGAMAIAIGLVIDDADVVFRPQAHRSHVTHAEAALHHHAPDVVRAVRFLVRDNQILAIVLRHPAHRLDRDGLADGVGQVRVREVLLGEPRGLGNDLDLAHVRAHHVHAPDAGDARDQRLDVVAGEIVQPRRLTPFDVVGEDGK